MVNFIIIVLKKIPLKESGWLIILGFLAIAQYSMVEGNGRSTGNQLIADTFASQLLDFEKEKAINRAEKLLLEIPKTVTSYPCVRSEGGIHDFFSEGPYWWPDPANPDGPYIRKDGMRNPDRFVSHDDELRYFSWIVAGLTSAYSITREEKYAIAALKHLNAWFVNPETKMNPNMLYAQAIKGICSGRGIGIIDALPLVEVAQSVRILEKSSSIPIQDVIKIKKWFSEFLNWLNTHPYGIEEMNWKNNHGSWWHVQAAAYASLVGDHEILEKCRKHYTENLLPNQMAIDGSFPFELERTKPYSYSLFNLEAFTTLAWILSEANIDIWNHTLDDGRNLKKAIDFMMPFIQDKILWPYGKDVDHWENQPSSRTFILFASIEYKNLEWFNCWKSLKEKTEEEELLSLPIKSPVLWLIGK
jgi:hypothetical protein